MSRLYFSERGRALIANNEEITRWRWAKKILKLPPKAAQAPAGLWLYVNLYDRNRKPLQVRLNGRALASLAPDPKLARMWSWQRIPIPGRRLLAGDNELILSCDSPAMNAWVIGLENGHRSPGSFVSTDRGRSWRGYAMGAHGVLQGEYMARIRSHAPGLVEQTPRGIVYEDPRHPRVRELLSLIPGRIRRLRDPWKQLLALRTWVAKSWTHDPSGRSYAPWDPWTVLDWAHRDWGHGQAGKVTMCVHFGAVFASLAAALGHRARCLAVTSDFNGWEGHFMAEAWDTGLGRWVLHDANYDVHYEDRRPLSGADISDLAHRGQSLEALVRRGPGFPKQPERVVNAFKLFASGRPFRLFGLWSLNNYTSEPEAAPPNHGSICYCETDFVWYNPAGMDLAPMFPFRADRRYFDRAP